ncbi:MAG: acyl-CoA dehydrogenase, partial [Gammaproteobacteria bacterium]|nr:acyl-CoA dehydrogenase [Gammaproteobacteria bacterium]
MSVLTPDLLGRIRSRAAGYDRDNAFFQEDLDELRAAGYLRPRTLLEIVRDQRLLAAHAPATALGLNMHLVWVGVARVLHDRGDESVDWILRDAEAGELFGFGISEPGNDLVLWDSVTTVDAVDGGFTFTGTKVFGTLSPAWTRFGIFGKQSEG